MTLRLGNIHDHDEILEILKTFYSEAPHNRYASFDEEKVSGQIKDYLNARKEEKIVILAEDGNKIFGVLAGIVVPVFFSNERRAYESVWYVLPEYRKHRDSIRLLDAYEFWARRVGCTTVGLSSMADERLDRFYAKHGYEKLEHSHVKRL